MLRVVPLSLLPSAAFTNHAVQHHIVSDRYNAQPGEFCWPPEEFLRAQLEIFGQVFARASLHLDAITLDLSISGQMLPVLVLVQVRWHVRTASALSFTHLPTRYLFVAFVSFHIILAFGDC